MFDLSLPIDHFKKGAKALLKQVQDREPAACERARQVFNDLSSKTDPEVSAALGLMRAQHILAVEHGFAKWDDLLQQSAVALRIAITMSRMPHLNDFGIGICRGDKDQSEADRRAKLMEDREKLRNSTGQVEATVMWLRDNLEPTKTINRRRSSYGLKHIAEKDIGYITNGVFITAAIIAGYPYEQIYGSPNVQFGISERSIKRIVHLDVGNRSSRLLTGYLTMAMKILADRGLHVHVASDKKGLVWREGEDMRTLLFLVQETHPVLIRLALDHYTSMVSQRVARALGDSNPSRFPMIAPARPKAEITVLPSEVELALSWALAQDTRLGPSDAPPFETAPLGRPSAVDAWEYVWSKRAVAAYRRRPSRQFQDAGYGAQ